MFLPWLAWLPAGGLVVSDDAILFVDPIGLTGYLYRIWVHSQE
jgi:hypothetical protein